MTTTNKLGLELLQNSAANQLLANATFAQINQLCQAAVIDKDLTAPPVSPANEALYIVGPSATGAWSGKDGRLAYWLTTTGVWQFITPREGMLVHVNDEDVYYKYTSSWSQLTANTTVIQCIPVACGDETSNLTAGAAKVTFRMPYAFTLTAVRASVTTAPTGSVLTVDINEGGTSILSTKLTIDATEKTSQTASAPPVISDASLADDAEITIDIDTVGSTVAGAGLKVYLIGVSG